MSYRQFGADNGRIIIYFHGAPGAPEECAIFDKHGKEHALRFICFDRFSADAALNGEAYYQRLAAEISGKAAEMPVDIIGFSLGAFVALQVCRYLPDEVRSLHLISAAAPLEAGDFLDSMAGKQVFRLAKVCPALFMALSYCQGLLAARYPKALLHLLFAGAAGKDRELAADGDFQSVIIKVLRTCINGRIKGYARDITAYVHPWASTLSEVTIDTHIWHGTEDNWSPKAMAEYLQAALPNCSQIEILPGLSHYSCLYEAAPKICRRLSM